tara:strand:+ start:4068 stop:7283 length:3216 start_codon:yes stop_codon:yes gene_type:complete
MANVTNTFIKSKMNKDLDDRLLSNGEYRDAQNVNISRSEGDDVGALENVLGNKLLTSFGDVYQSTEVIGYLADPGGNFLYVFTTNYTDTSSDELSNSAPYGAVCKILKAPLQDFNASIPPIVLAEGRFLNFSKTHPIYGISLIEDLLFWTDDRNQPRKINVVTTAAAFAQRALNEDAVSVAKYYPFKVPYLHEEVSVPISTSPASGGFGVTTADALLLRAGDILKVPYQNLGGTNGSTEIFYPIQIKEIKYTGFVGTGTAGFTVNVLPSPDIRGTTVTFLRPSGKRVTPRYLPEFNSGQFVSQSTALDASGNNTLVLKAWWSIGNLVGDNAKLIGNFNNSTDILTTSSQIPGPSSSPTVLEGQARIEINQLISPAPDVDDILAFRQPNPEYTDTWPGDADLLSDKFVRFAYRFKFDDGEYSLISPFTQPAFIPKQDGYFNTFVKQKNIIPGVTTNVDSYRSDLETTQASTIVSFFENKVQDVLIHIPTEFPVNTLNDKLNVLEIDILYKESDGLAIQVLETISVTDSSISSNSSSVIEYRYQSRKPFKTLPGNEISRVFDKVPIRAKSLSVTGGRVIYGNFLNKHTPPENLNFGVSISDKSRPADGSNPGTVGNISNLNFSTIAYPNHTVKQNRNYQVGIVLSDRYGRQSDVILSSIKNFEFKQVNGTEVFGGSSIYHPYKEAGATYEDLGNGTGDFGKQGDVINGESAMPFSWFGDSIKICFIDKIPETVSYAEGYPGLYKSGEYTAETTGVVTNNSIPLAASNYLPYIEIGDVVSFPDQENLRPAVIIGITGGAEFGQTLQLSKDVNLGENEEINISGTENKLGWYSYKVVVQQQKQEYYNAYLPLIVNDVPGGIDSNSVTQAYTTLISDNINKIPPDLGEVQPEQTQFRTSDELLYPRVLTSNFSLSYIKFITSPGSTEDIYLQGAYGFQSSLGLEYFVIDTIGKTTDLGVNTNDLTASPPEVITTAPGIYDAKSNPPVGRISTFSTQAGYSSFSSLSNYPLPSPVLTSTPRLTGLSQAISILEVDPPMSRLEIFWETSTTGLVEELNNAIDAGVSTVEVLPSPPTGG